MKSFFLTLDRWIMGACLHVACFLLAVIACLGLWQVMARFIFSQPSTFTEEAMRRLLIWIVMLGMAVAVRRGAMVSVDLMLRLSRGAWGRFVRRFILGVNLAFFSSVLWFGVDLAWRVRFQTFASIEISMSWAYAAVPAGALLAIVATLAHYFDPQNQELEAAQ